MADDKEVEKTIAEDLVVTKYKLAGQIVNRKLTKKHIIVKEMWVCWCLIGNLLWFEWTRVIRGHADNVPPTS